MDAKKPQNPGSDETISQFPSPLGLLFISLRENHSDDLCSIRNAEELSSYAYWPLPFTKNHVLELIKYQRAYLPEYEKTYLLYRSGDHKLVGEVTIELNQQSKDHIGLRFILGSEQLFSRALLLKEIVNYACKMQHCHKMYTLVPARQTDLLQDLYDAGFEQEAYMKKSILIQSKWEDEIYLGYFQR